MINPESDIVCAMLYIYSMETFIYSAVNSATRDHDESKIQSLGPLACALAIILSFGEKRRPIDSESLPRDKFTDLYRGLNLPADVIQQYKNLKGNSFCMGGFISTSLNETESIYHALKNQDQNTKPVIMHIQYCDEEGFNYFRLNTSKYSAMP